MMGTSTISFQTLYLNIRDFRLGWDTQCLRNDWDLCMSVAPTSVGYNQNELQWIISSNLNLCTCDDQWELGVQIFCKNPPRCM